MTAASLGLSDAQYRNLLGIVAAVKAYEPVQADPHRAAELAVCCALTESGLQNYANGNIPESLTYPHDAIGWDHASVGLFQQQVGAGFGWGTVEQCMDPTYATQAFLGRLVGVTTWLTDTLPWMTIQAVQVSAFADGSNYHANYGHAVALVQAVWQPEDPQGGGTPLITDESEDDGMRFVKNTDNGHYYVVLPDGHRHVITDPDPARAIGIIAQANGMPPVDLSKIPTTNTGTLQANDRILAAAGIKTT